ncbi:MAG TPA: hypothetical protein VMF89_13200, partial [Polyangiales bacterium]|nr:hypothetical protein [Polyangiales bacterium]
MRVVLVAEEGRVVGEPAVQRFRQWAADIAGLALSPDEVDVCTSHSLAARLAALGSKAGDLLMYPANASGVMALNKIPVDALWSLSAEAGASILFGQRKMAARRVLVLT